MQLDRQIVDTQVVQCLVLILPMYFFLIIYNLTQAMLSGLIEIGLFFREDICQCYSIHCY